MRAPADLPSRPSVPGAGATADRLPVTAVLAAAEARRMVSHPVALVALALTLLGLSADYQGRPAAAFDNLTTATTFAYGVLGFFAANLVATRDRRAGTEEMLAATRTPVSARVLATCLATVGPAVVAAVVTGVAFAVFEARNYLVVSSSFWHLAQGPVTVLGGALLGVMVGRWTTVPGAPVLVMVTVIAFNLWTSGANEARLGPIGMYTGWANWSSDAGGWEGMDPGSPAWHVAYLLALCGMAAVGALLRDSERRLLLLSIGALLTVAAVGSGWAALP